MTRQTPSSLKIPCSLLSGIYNIIRDQEEKNFSHL